MNPKTAFLIDIDGVIRLGEHPIEGAGTTLEYLRKRGIPFLLVTNNSTRTPQHVSEFLRKIGVDVRPSEVFTSALATSLYLKNTYGTGKSAYVIGESGLTEAISSIDWQIVNHWSKAEFVVVGLDTKFNYEKLENAVRAIVLKKAKFVATNADRALIQIDGPKPGAGAMVAAIEYASEAKAFVVGKPNPLIGKLAIQKLGMPEDARIFVVGDRLETDMSLAKAIGAEGILVLTGATKESDIKNKPQKTLPKFIIRSIAELPELLDKIL